MGLQSSNRTARNICWCEVEEFKGKLNYGQVCLGLSAGAQNLLMAAIISLIYSLRTLTQFKNYIALIPEWFTKRGNLLNIWAYWKAETVEVSHFLFERYVSLRIQIERRQISTTWNLFKPIPSCTSAIAPGQIDQGGDMIWYHFFISGIPLESNSPFLTFTSRFLNSLNCLILSFLFVKKKWKRKVSIFNQ